MDTQTDIAILGAGIGGYETFRSLTKQFKRHGIKKTITLIDHNNYFTFTPMLHEVASGSIEPQHAAIPIRELVYKTKHRFLKTHVQSIDPQKKIIETTDGKISYEYCVVALGSGVNFFGVSGADQYAYTVRTLSSAMKLHNDLFELLDKTTGDKVSLNIVGGGYTGVELAGQFMHLAKHQLKKLYPEKKLKIVVIEHGPSILGVLPQKVQTTVQKLLEKSGVEFLLNQDVQKIESNKIYLASGKTVESDMVVWSAGVKNTGTTILPAEFCEKDRIPTNEFLQHKNIPSLYAVGDIALSFNSGADKPQPQLGEAAHKEGEYVAKHLTATILNKKIKPFHFHSFGTLMPIGDWFGVAIIGKWVFFGRIAWWIRRTAYLLFIPGLLRRLRIVIDWTLHSLGFRYMIALEKKDPTELKP
jgi:NADH dehydrogenase